MWSQMAMVKLYILTHSRVTDGTHQYNITHIMMLYIIFIVIFSLFSRYN